MKKKIVFVGMSGGVDSSVSAALLQKQGYDVVGVFIRTWHPDFIKCNEEEERRDAMRVATHLNIPFLTFDFSDVYKKEVADYMIAEYKAGRTPNPDVMCNKEVKFGAFLKKALAMGADFVATGHYARICEGSSCFELPEGPAPVIGGRAQGRKTRRGRVNLRKGIDPSKDQAYFLWTLKQDQLKKILFPVGHLNKTEVRKLAKKFKLPVAAKKDSQGICFLGAVDLKDFLKHYIKEKRGKVVLASSGKRSDLKNSKRSDLEELETIGYHNGAVFSTLGERHGFTITKKNPTDGPYYIVGKDIKKNILYVSQRPAEKRPVLEEERSDGKGLALGRLAIKLKDTNWISEIPKQNKNYTAQVRYHGELLSCKIKITGKTKAIITFKKPVLVAPGQSCVIYDRDICLGGGVIA